MFVLWENVWFAEKKPSRFFFKDAIVKTYICSERCLRKYFEPIGGVKIMQKKLKENEAWLN